MKPSFNAWLSILLFAAVAELTAGTRFGALTAGSHHCCFLDRLCDMPVLKCWGRNAAGQLGTGDTLNRGQSSDEMDSALAPIDLGAGVQPEQISSGSDHTCVLTDEGKVKCFGSNVAGQLGYGDFVNRGQGADQMADLLPFLDLGAGRRAQSVSSGFYHSCALLQDASVVCWGYNQYGQLLKGDTSNGMQMGDSLTPLAIGKNVSKVSAGGYHTCVLLTDGQVLCWGNNNAGQLGLGDTINRGSNASDPQASALKPVDLGGQQAVDIASGGYHTCAILWDGSLKCWGRCDVGQCGQSSTNNIGDEAGELGSALDPVNLGGLKAVGISLGLVHTCVLMTDPSARQTVSPSALCFGYGALGQLGLGDSQDFGGQASDFAGSVTPSMHLGGGVVDIQAGWYHTCALLENGAIKCVGSNLFGQLGIGSDAKSKGTIPQELGPMLPSIRLGSCTSECVACGSLSFCSIESNNTVKCNQCTRCSDSEFVSSTCAQFSDGVCGDCLASSCPAGWFRGGCGADGPGSCQRCSMCPEGSFKTQGCLQRSDTQCSQCKVCNETEYEESECGEFSNRTCGSCEDLPCAEGLVRTDCGLGNIGSCSDPSTLTTTPDPRSIQNFPLAMILGLVIGLIPAVCLCIAKFNRMKKDSKLHPAPQLPKEIAQKVLGPYPERDLKAKAKHRTNTEPLSVMQVIIQPNQSPYSSVASGRKFASSSTTTSGASSPLQGPNPNPPEGSVRLQARKTPTTGLHSPYKASRVPSTDSSSSSTSRTPATIGPEGFESGGHMTRGRKPLTESDFEDPHPLRPSAPNPLRLSAPSALRPSDPKSGFQPPNPLAHHPIPSRLRDIEAALQKAEDEALGSSLNQVSGTLNPKP